MKKRMMKQQYTGSINQRNAENMTLIGINSRKLQREISEIGGDPQDQGKFLYGINPFNYYPHNLIHRFINRSYI